MQLEISRYISLAARHIIKVMPPSLYRPTIKPSAIISIVAEEMRTMRFLCFGVKFVLLSIVMIVVDGLLFFVSWFVIGCGGGGGIPPLLVNPPFLGISAKIILVETALVETVLVETRFSIMPTIGNRRKEEVVESYGFPNPIDFAIIKSKLEKRKTTPIVTACIFDKRIIS